MIDITTVSAKDLLSNPWFDGVTATLLLAALQRWLKIFNRGWAVLKALKAWERRSWSKWYLREGVYEDNRPHWTTYWVSLLRSYFAETTIPNQPPSGRFQVHLKLFNSTPFDALYTLFEGPVEIEGWNGTRYTALGTSRFVPPTRPQIAPPWSVMTETHGYIDAPAPAAALAAQGVPVRIKFVVSASVAPPTSGSQAPLIEKFLIETNIGDEPK